MVCLFGDDQMTTAENASRNERQLEKILTVVKADPVLQHHVPKVHVSIEDTSVALRGELPDDGAKNALLLAVRQAGVLDKICDYVRVSSAAG